MPTRYDRIVNELNKLEEELNNLDEVLEEGVTPEGVDFLNYKQIDLILKQIELLEQKVNAAMKAAKNASPAASTSHQHKKEAFFPSGGVGNHAGTKKQSKKLEHGHKPKTKPE